MNIRMIAIAAALAAAALGSGVAHARGDVQWSVTVASPELRLPGGGVIYLPPIPLPRVVVQPRHEVEYRDAPRHGGDYRDAPRHGGDYREPRRWDVDGDGIPNRYDRTPRGEHESHDHRRWRDDRHDDRRDDRRDGRDGRRDGWRD